MKICVTGLRGIPNVMGGVETHCEQLYPRIAAIEPAMRIVVYARSPYVGAAPYMHQGVEVVPLWTLRSQSLESLLHTLLTILHARFVQRADAVHIHAVGPALMAPLARLLGLRVIATHHGADYARDKWGSVARGALRLGEACMARFSDATICVSRSGAEDMRRRWPRSAGRVRHFPNGAELPEPVEIAPLLAEFGLTSGEYVLAVGRLVPEKGFHELIEAFARAPRGRKLLIVGAADHDGPFSARLLAMASDRVVFAGRRSRAELAALYRHAALFVLPSHHEGNPIAALEAMLSGAPLLLSDIAPNLELGLPPACHFPVGDVEALAGRLDADAFDGMRVADPERLVAYRWDRIAAGTLDVLRDVAVRP